MRNATAFYHKALGEKDTFSYHPFHFLAYLYWCCYQKKWVVVMLISLQHGWDEQNTKNPPALCGLRRTKRLPVLSELRVDRSAMISVGKKDLTSACFSGLLTGRLSSRDPSSLPAVPWRGFWLPTVSKTGTHLQPPAFHYKEEAEFAGWEGSRGALPSPEAELQRAVQVSPESLCRGK